MKKLHKNIFNLLLFIVLLSFTPKTYGQFFYGLQQEYGKNRVQYNEFDWVFYRFERFDVYFYRGNEELAEQVARLTEKELVRVENFMDSPLEDRVKIMVFNNLSDLKQSNVNGSYDETGITRISGQRLFVYFDGSYTHLQESLRSGLTEVVMSNLFYGSFRESLKSATMLNLPEWYTEGLISYMGRSWSSEVETQVRDVILSQKIKRINSLRGLEARYAGHSFWYFISQTYGSKVIKNIVYMAVVNRNIESGFSYILGKDIKDITRDWKQFYENYYQAVPPVDEFNEKPFYKAPKTKKVVRLRQSKDGQYLAYVKQKLGEYEVVLHHTATGKNKKVLKGGYKIAQNTDYSYPLLAWHPNGKILTMITEEKGFIYLNFYNTEKKELEKKTLFKFDKILSIDYSKDGKQLLFSAHKNGQSDIYIYNILNTKITQLTNDDYDDLYPAFYDHDKKVMFSSNRVSDKLIKGEQLKDKAPFYYDLFAMPAQEPEDTSALWRITATDDVDELQVRTYSPSYMAFTSDFYGTRNRHLIKLDSAISFVDTTTHYAYSFDEYKFTNLNRSILDEDFSQEGGAIYSLILRDRQYQIYKTDYVDPESLSLEKIKAAVLPPVQEQKPVSDTLSSKNNERVVNEDNKSLYYPEVNPELFEIDINNYRFDFEKDNKEEKAPPKEKEELIPLLPALELAIEEEDSYEELEIPPKRNYMLSFYKNDFTLDVGNVFMNPQYQAFTGFVTPDLLNFGFNANIKAGVLDLMHDYTITGAVSTAFQPLPGTSLAPNAEFYFLIGDYKNKWDKEYVLSRRSRIQPLGLNDISRIITHEVLPKISYPFSPVASVRATLGYRIDKTILLSREFNPNSLTTPDVYRDYIVARLAYVYDNTREIGLNLYEGLRYKVFTEYYRNLKVSPTGLHTAGIDARHYTVIHRNLIWANRFASGVSFGPEKLIYIMGGVDNAFSFKFEPTTPIAPDNNYIFQTLITNMRGAYQNVRNGDKFAVVNSELRWPIVSYFIQRPIRSDFFKNIQAVGFADLGTAWNGVSPYSKENVINTREVSYGPSGSQSKVVVDSQTDPFVLGYGVGARTRLFGYFLRFDWAWSLQSGVVQPNVFYFSLGTDF